MKDVKNAIEDIRKSLTLKRVLGVLLAIGNFLNGSKVGSYLIKSEADRHAPCRADTNFEYI